MLRSPMSESTPNFREAYFLGKNHGGPQILKDEAKSIPYLILQKGDEEHVQSLEHLLAEPKRQRGYYVMGDIDSFIRFVNDNQTEQCAIWANESMFPDDHRYAGKSFICCIFNDNRGKVPGWQDFVCWMLVESNETEKTFEQIQTKLKAPPFYKGMPDLKLPKSLQ